MAMTPRRNKDIRRLDRCSPFSLQGYPACAGCDQFKGSSTCYTSCGTNTFETYYTSNACEKYNCSSDMCLSCYKDTTARSNNYCTSCIANAELVDGSLGTCKCKAGYYYAAGSNTCEKCHPYCKTCSKGPLATQCDVCMPGYPRWLGECKTSCSVIDFPFNTTYVYSSGTCIPCKDQFYTVDSKNCLARPYPVMVKNYNNKYLILQFSQPVKYTNAYNVEKII